MRSLPILLVALGFVLACCGTAAATTNTALLDLGATPDDRRCASDMDALDLDGDGRDELVTTCVIDGPGGAVTPPITAWRWDTATSTFVKLDEVSSPAGVLGCLDLDHGDVTGDGREDLVLGCLGYVDDPTAGGAFLVPGDATGFASEPTRLPAPAGAPADVGACTQVAVGDVTADSIPDVTASCAVGVAGWSGGSGVPSAGTWSRPFQERCQRPRIGDVDGNGHGDLAMLCAGDLLRIMFRDVSGAVRTQAIALQVDARVSCGLELDVADAMGDARPELLYPCQGETVGTVAAASWQSTVPASAFAFGYLGSTGRYTVTLPWLAWRCTGMSTTGLRGWGRAGRVVAIGCPTRSGGDATLIMRTAASSKQGTLLDVVSGPSGGTDSGCGAVVDAGDFDGDGRDDLVMTCGYTGSTWNASTSESRYRRVAMTLGARGMSGSARSDLLVGSARADVLAGRGGDDVLRGLGGADRLSGGAGADLLVANDRWADVVDCGLGRDRAIVDRRDRVRGCETVIRR